MQRCAPLDFLGGYDFRLWLLFPESTLGHFGGLATGFLLGRVFADRQPALVLNAPAPIFWVGSRALW